MCEHFNACIYHICIYICIYICVCSFVCGFRASANGFQFMTTVLGQAFDPGEASALCDALRRGFGPKHILGYMLYI